MKKLIASLILTTFAPSLLALPLGNPADPHLYAQGVFFIPSDDLSGCPSTALSFRAGYYGDFVFNRHLRRQGATKDVIEHATLNTNAAFVAVNFWDRFDLFGTVGATDCFISSNLLIGPRFELDYRTGTSWSIGGRAILLNFGRSSFGIEGQYFGTNLRIERFTVGADTSVYPDQFGAKFREAQVGLGVAYTIFNVSPYAGIKWSRLTINNGDAIILGVEFPNIRSEKHFGYAVGVTLLDCDAASLSAEARFSDEKALYINGQLRF